MIMKQVKGSKGKSIKIIILTLTAVMIVFTSFFVYRNIQESSHRKRYPELYIIKDYLINIEEVGDLCEELRYDSNGKEVEFYTLYGFEDGFENDFHKIIRPELETDEYTIRYHVEYVHFDERYSESRLSDRLKKKLFLQNTKLRLDFYVYRTDEDYTHYKMEYNYNDFSYTTTILGKNHVEISKEFDEQGQEIYELILKDMTKRIDKCEEKKSV